MQSWGEPRESTACCNTGGKREESTTWRDFSSTTCHWDAILRGRLLVAQPGGSSAALSVAGSGSAVPQHGVTTLSTLSGPAQLPNPLAPPGHPEPARDPASCWLCWKPETSGLQVASTLSWTGKESKGAPRAACCSSALCLGPGPASPTKACQGTARFGAGPLLSQAHIPLLPFLSPFCTTQLLLATN